MIVINLKDYFKEDSNVYKHYSLNKDLESITYNVDINFFSYASFLSIQKLLNNENVFIDTNNLEEIPEIVKVVIFCGFKKEVMCLLYKALLEYMLSEVAPKEFYTKIFREIYV